MVTAPLGGLRVLELTRLLPGPWCTMVLADFGADVIKVEPPGVGDYSRNAAPFYGQDGMYFSHVNRNKRSVVLDLKVAAGREAFLRLAERADVIVEGFRPGVAGSLGIDYESIRAINPGIVYCALTGFGQTGPYSQLPGHNANIVSLSGLLTYANPEPPRQPNFQVADYAASTMALSGILIALQGRQQSGRGQYLDVSMLDSMVSWLAIPAVEHFSGHSPEELNSILGSSRGFSPRNGIYETSDGKYLSVSILERKFWEDFCRLVSRPDLINEAETMADRLGAHGSQPHLRQELADLIRTRTRDEWFDLCREHNIPVVPVYTVPETLSDRHVQAREMVCSMENRHGQRIGQLGSPIKLSETPASIRRPPPGFGQHTAEVLAEIGYTQEEILRMSKNRAATPDAIRQ